MQTVLFCNPALLRVFDADARQPKAVRGRSAASTAAPAGPWGEGPRVSRALSLCVFILMIIYQAGCVVVVCAYPRIILFSNCNKP